MKKMSIGIVLSKIVQRNCERGHTAKLGRAIPPHGRLLRRGAFGVTPRNDSEVTI